MKRIAKSMLGVTLLEIMLVLAIAAMIVVMSIRYYQSASASQQANAGAGQVQAIMAAMDNLGTAGGYASNATQSTVTAVMGGSANMITPGGGTIEVGSTTATTYTVKFDFKTAAVCENVKAKLASTPKASATCADGSLTLSYDAAK